MKYQFITSAVLLTLLFIPLNAMAEKITKDEKGEVVHLTKYCQECLLHCAKSRRFGEFSLEECAKTVCMDVCKTEEE
jgi:hypothetical protein